MSRGNRSADVIPWSTSAFIAGTWGLTAHDSGVLGLLIIHAWRLRRPLSEEEVVTLCKIRRRAWERSKLELIQWQQIVLTSRGVWPVLIDQFISEAGRRSLSTSDRAAVFARYGYCCAYCGTVEGVFHIDHIIPVARGGTNSLDNLTVACSGCNLSKGDRLLEEWM